MLKILVGALTGVLLYTSAGCASSGGREPVYLLPAGSEVRLSERLEARNGARINIQDGHALGYSKVQLTRPYCQFKVRRPPQEMRDPLLIAAGKFVVKRSYQQLNYAVAGPIQVAGNVASNSELSTIMELSSSGAQPNVEVLVCVRWGTIRLDGYLTLSEIRSTLGDLVALSLPE